MELTDLGTPRRLSVVPQSSRTRHRAGLSLPPTSPILPPRAPCTQPIDTYPLNTSNPRMKKTLQTGHDMSNNPSGRGQVVTAQFSHGEDTRTNDCIINDCDCECHDDAPLPAGTYVTIHLADDQAVGVGGHVKIQPDPEQEPQARPDALPEHRGSVILVTKFNGVPLPWTVYASRKECRWVTLDGTDWPGVGQEASDAEITGWHPINLVPSEGAS